MNDNRPVAFSAQRAPARSSRVLPRSSRERASSPVIGDRDGDGGARCARRDARAGEDNSPRGENRNARNDGGHGHEVARSKVPT